MADRLDAGSETRPAHSPPAAGSDAMPAGIGPRGARSCQPEVATLASQVRADERIGTACRSPSWLTSVKSAACRVSVPLAVAPDPQAACVALAEVRRIGAPPSACASGAGQLAHTRCRSAPTASAMSRSAIRGRCTPVASATRRSSSSSSAPCAVSSTSASGSRGRALSGR